MAASKPCVRFLFYRYAVDEAPQHTLDIKPVNSDSGKLEHYEIAYKEKKTTVTMKPDSLESYVWLFIKSVPIAQNMPEMIVVDVPGFPTMKYRNGGIDVEDFKEHVASLVKLLAIQPRWPTVAPPT